jgi:hypothetical protein
MMVEAMMWIILVTNNGATELEWHIPFQSMARCEMDAAPINDGVFHRLADGWDVKSATCCPFMQDLTQCAADKERSRQHE